MPCQVILEGHCSIVKTTWCIRNRQRYERSQWEAYWSAITQLLAKHLELFELPLSYHREALLGDALVGAAHLEKVVVANLVLMAGLLFFISFGLLIVLVRIRSRILKTYVIIFEGDFLFLVRAQW